MRRLPRRSKIRSRAGNSAGQVFAVLAAGATVALATLATDQYVTAAKRVAATGGAGKAGIAVTAAVAGQSDDDVYTGSILYMPRDGRFCRQLLFDNQNGQFTDNGYVDCAQAAYNGLDGPKHWSAARLRVIATGFRGD